MFGQYFEITLAFLAFALFHSIFAGERVKTRVSKWLGKFGYGYRFLYTMLSLLALGMILWQLPPQGALLYTVPAPWRWLLYGVQFLAVTGFLAALRDFSGNSFLGITQLRRRKPLAADKLNVNGLFRFCRHPLYVTSTIFLLATPTMTSGELAYVINIVMYFAVGSIFEERRLEKQFGNAYLEYKRRVPRFVPRCWNRKEESLVIENPGDCS